jgi:hypothetical protein
VPREGRSGVAQVPLLRISPVSASHPELRSDFLSVTFSRSAFDLQSNGATGGSEEESNSSLDWTSYVEIHTSELKRLSMSVQSNFTR